MDADTLTEKILEASSDVVGSASGLFVDGSFVGAVENRGEVETFLRRCSIPIPPVPKGNGWSLCGISSSWTACIPRIP